MFADVRVQLGEQLRCLDSRLETQVALVQELQDYFRRRAEVELEYSRGLDKLARSLTLRHKEQKLKREQWPLFSSYSCWQQLVTVRWEGDFASGSDSHSDSLFNCQDVVESWSRLIALRIRGLAMTIDSLKPTLSPKFSEILSNLTQLQLSL